MPKAKPISLYPLTFDEALKRLIHTTSNAEQAPKHVPKAKPKKKKR